MKPIAIDATYLTQTLADLVRINSTNPDLSADGAGEAEIATYCSVAMRKLGMRVDFIEHTPGRRSALGSLPGQGGRPARSSQPALPAGRWPTTSPAQNRQPPPSPPPPRFPASLQLNAHIDTVGVQGMPDPFSGAIRSGRLYGRGAQDMKGSLAASLAAVKALVEAGIQLQGDLQVACVADEEWGSLGTAGVIEHLRSQGRLPAAAIVTEPTDLRLCLAQRGFSIFEVETFGRAAHGSRFRDGVDANRMMGRVLVALDELDRQLQVRPPHPLAGPPSLHAPLIHGGTETSIYAAHCTLQIERRTAPGESEAQVASEFQALLDRLAADDSRFQASLRPLFGRPPFEAHPDSVLVPAIQRAADLAGAERFPVEARSPAQSSPASPLLPSGVSFWTDAALLAEAGVDCAVFGPIGGGLHTTEEWVDLDSCVLLAECLALTAIEYCGA